jgi:hypothetical protein
MIGPENKPFCARCGWNLDRAERAIGGKATMMKFIPFGIALLALAVAAMAANAKSVLPLLIPLAVGGVLLIPFSSYFSTRKVVAAAKLSVNPSLALSQPPLDPYLQQLQVLPRPRRVRFRFPGSFVAALGVFLILAVGFIVALVIAPANSANHHGNPQSNGSPVVVLVVLLPTVFLMVFLIPFFRSKGSIPLLRDGDFALGRVTYQEVLQQGKTSYSHIGYEFKTSSGQLVQEQTKDLTFSVFEDMTIPVFYDPQDPSKNITPCATYLSVLTAPY